MAAGKLVTLALNNAPRAAVNLAGKLKGILGPKMYAKMGGLRGLQQVGQEGLYSGLFSGGMTAAGQVMSGEGLDIPEILAYGLAVGGVKALRGSKGLRKGTIKDKTGKTKEVVITPKELMRSRGELPANVVASMLTPMGVSAALNKQPQQVQQSAQTQQVDQQQLQRMLLNEGLLAGQYLPGTMFQGMGVQPPQSLMQQYLNDQGPTVRMDPASMAAIVGL